MRLAPRPSPGLAVCLCIAMVPLHSLALALTPVHTSPRTQRLPPSRPTVSSRVLMTASPSVGTLYDVPVSNNGARCRMVLYYKDIGEDEVAIVSPKAIGGLKSEEFLKLNPNGLMPVLALASGEALPESDTISRYLCSAFADRPPVDLLPQEPLLAAKCDRISRLHDIHLASIQGCMYKQTAPTAPHPFGRFATRGAAIDSFVQQLQVLESYADAEGPYLLDSKPSTADCAVFPTAVFWMHMLPKFGIDTAECMGPRLTRWWEHMREADPTGARVYAEIMDSLTAWDDRGRWNSIRGAGLCDEAAPTVFDKIIAGEIPSAIVYEDELVLAFRDISPVAPTHVLLIPKAREGLTQLQLATAEHRGVLGHMLAVAVPSIVKSEGLEAYRVVINDGAEACQSVFHLHMHIIGGKRLSWPPGV